MEQAEREVHGVHTLPLEVVREVRRSTQGLREEQIVLAQDMVEAEAEQRVLRQTVVNTVGLEAHQGAEAEAVVLLLMVRLPTMQGAQAQLAKSGFGRIR